MTEKQKTLIFFLFVLSALLTAIVITSKQSEKELIRDYRAGKSVPDNNELYISVNIPTWPEYIETEKDITIIIDFPEPNSPGLIQSDWEIFFDKGTKIYQKERTNDSRGIH